MFKLFGFSFSYSILIFLYVTNLLPSYSFGAEYICKNYLEFSMLNTSPDEHPNLFYDTLDSLVATKNQLLETRAILLSSLRLEMIERALPLKTPGLKPVPSIAPEELAKLYRLQSTYLHSEAYSKLEEEILADPYFSWLLINWVDYRSNYDRSFAVDLTSAQPTKYNTTETLKAPAEDIPGYFRQHLFYEGQMSLQPELLVYRIMRDHDPKLSDTSRSMIKEVLGLERTLFILNEMITGLANFDFGHKESWREFVSLKPVLAEFNALKSKIQFLSYPGDMRDYLRRQLQEEFSLDMSFETHYVVVYLTQSINPEDQELYDRYVLLRNILHLVTMAQDQDQLLEFLEEQADQSWPYYLY